MNIIEELDKLIEENRGELNLTDCAYHFHDATKQETIEKAVNYIYNHAHVTTFGDIRLEKCSMNQFVEDFKRYMENN